MNPNENNQPKGANLVEKSSPLPFLLSQSTKARFKSHFDKATDKALTALLDAYEHNSSATSEDAERISELQSQIDSINTEKARIDSELKEAQKSIKENSQRILDKDKEIEELKKQLKVAQEKSGNNQSEEIASLQKTVKDKEEAIKNMESDILKMDKKIADHQQTTDALNLQIKERDEKIQSLEAELKTAKDAASAAADQTGSDRKVIDGYISAKTALEKQNKELQTKLDDATAELTRVKHTVLEYEQAANQNPINSYPEGDILHYFPEVTAKLLEATCQRLTEKRRRIKNNPDLPEIKPQDVLADNFLKYTIQRYNLWFYKWVLDDKEILTIIQSVCPEIKSIKAFKAVMHITD